jgi:hypothetical protein
MSPQQAIGFPSSYSTEWAGAKAAFLVLQQIGYGTERWEQPPQSLPEDPQDTTLILAEPFERGTNSDREAVTRFIRAGGRLLAIGANAAAFAPEASMVEAAEWKPEPEAITYRPLLPSPLALGAPEITMITPDHWRRKPGSQLVVYGDNATAAVVAYRIGRGEVIWWASASPLENGSIRDKSNLALLLNSVGEKPRRILWDEYFHGARGSLLAYFANTPLPWAALQIGVAFAAILFTFSRRSGPVRMPAVESRLSPLEFVETLGDLYHSANAASASVAVAYQRLRLSLSRKLGTSPTMKPPELCQLASSRLGWPEAPLLGTLSQAEREMRNISLDGDVALELVRELHDYSGRLEARRAPAKG